MSKLLLDIVRCLKRVDAHLAAAVYPILCIKNNDPTLIEPIGLA